MTAIVTGPAPGWIAMALREARGAVVTMAVGGQASFEACSAQIAAELLERLPMPAIAEAIAKAVRDQISIGLVSVHPVGIGERASREIVGVLSAPTEDAPTDRAAYLEVSAELDRFGVPRVRGGTDDRMSLAERVRWLAQLGSVKRARGAAAALRAAILNLDEPPIEITEGLEILDGRKEPPP